MPHGHIIQAPSFLQNIILQAVFFCLRCSVSYRDLEEIMAGRALVEQDHRFIKHRERPMLGFKSLASAASTIADIEIVNVIRKGQFRPDLRSLQQLCRLAA
jgi:transposase-like protein